MSDFIKVVQDWRRMCKSYSDIGSCGTCPLQENDTCANIETATDDDITNAERVIKEWCEKNPEVVYPTWAEWLLKVKGGSIYIHKKGGGIVIVANDTEIPADVAKKLGIEPKKVRRS